MARYEFECQDDRGLTVHTFFESHAMGKCPPSSVCDEHNLVALRTFDSNFEQDTRRFRVGRSQATGQPYAESRAEERRIEKERGISFVGRNDLTAKEKHLASYAKHVREGGERVASDVINPPEKVQRKTVQQVLREKNVRFG